MSNPTPKPPSFSAASRWRIGFDMVLRTLLVLAVVVMANYLGTRFYHRYYLSSQTRVALAPRTLNVLHSLTNRVAVTLYYDRTADFYPDILALLHEYVAASKYISLRMVDYGRDAGEAELVKQEYPQIQSGKDLVIFDYSGRVKVVPGALLTSSETKLKSAHPSKSDPQKPELEFERRPVTFNGEQAFTTVLLSLANPQPLKAYFVEGHKGPSLTDSDKLGYQKFAAVLQENYITNAPLSLGNAPVPTDCNLLIIAGPEKPFDDVEAQQIGQYLDEGGRLMVLLNCLSQGKPTGLEALMQKWDVGVADDVAQDAEHTESTHDIVVNTYGKHPIVDSLSQVQLQVYSPRVIYKLSQPSAAGTALQVDQLFYTSPGGTLLVNRAEPPHQYPLACAVEQKPVAGVTHPRGNTRMVVVGDDIFLGNYYLNIDGNRDFLNASLNWLCDRPQLVAGIGPRPVSDFRLVITKHQRHQLGWLLLGALPGTVLGLGWLVWLVRRR